MDAKKRIRVSYRNEMESRLDSVIEEFIREGLERYALRYDPDESARYTDPQRSLPFDGCTRRLPTELFPVDVCEILREFFPEGYVRPAEHLVQGASGGLVLARSLWMENAPGSLPIIEVRSEHLDSEERPTHIGRFGALRELARLISCQYCDRDKSRPFDPSELTVEVGGGEFLLKGFFEERLNRWAMCLGCPPLELSELLHDAWGDLPITPGHVEELRPFCVAGRNGREIVFLEKRYGEKGLEEIFGLTANALIGWCRYLELINW